MTVDITFKIQRMGEDAPGIPIKIRLLQPSAYLPDASVPRYDYETVTDSLGEATITVDTPGTGFSWPFSCSVDNKDTCSFSLGDDNGPTITWRYIQENLCGLNPIPPSPPIYIPVITPATTGNLVQQTADGALEDLAIAGDDVATITYTNKLISNEFNDMGLLAWYEARYIQLDTDAPVPAIFDISGNDFHLLQATTSKQPLYKLDSSGKPYVSFDGIDDFLRVSTNPAPTQEYSMFLVARYQAAYSVASTVMDGGGAVNTARLFRPSSRQLTYYAGASLILSLANETAWDIYQIKVNGASSEIVANASTITGNAGANVPAGITLAATGLATPSEFANIDFRALLIFDGTLTDTQEKNVRQYLETLGGIPVVFVGDSITLGTGATGATGFAQLYIASNGTKVLGTNLGVGGLEIVTMRDNAPSDSQPRATTTLGATVCIFGGTNDFTTGTTAIEAHAALKQCANIWNANGYKVVVVTMLPRTGYDTERAEYNTLIRNNYTDYAESLADVGADANMGQNGDNTDLTYYDADQVHPNDAGHAIIESYVSAAITWI